MERILILLIIPYKQPVFIAWEKFALHPAFAESLLAILSIISRRNLDALDLTLHCPDGLGARSGQKLVKAAHARHGGLLVVEVNASRGREQQIPKVEEGFLDLGRVVVGTFEKGV